MNARKMIREHADKFNARTDDPVPNSSSAQRAFGRVQRKLAEAGIELSYDGAMDLMAYAHGYVEATTGVDEARPPSLANEIDVRHDARDAGARAARVKAVR